MSNVQQLPIGVFDSGVGGLSVPYCGDARKAAC